MTTRSKRLQFRLFQQRFLYSVEACVAVELRGRVVQASPVALACEQALR